MSADTAPRVGVQREHRMLNLGQAVPASSSVFGEKRAPASEGKKHSQISAEHQAWLDGQETTSRCTECPDWSFTGPASDARTASATHRVELHPELVGRRTPRRGRSILTRGAKTEQQIADIAGAKAARLERDRVELEERLETTAQRVNRTGESSHGDRHTHQQEDDMETLARPTKPHGYWTVERIVDGFKEHARRTGRAPATTILNGSTGDRPDYLPSYTSMLKVATYAEILAAAGLEKPKRAVRARNRAHGATPRVQPQPQPQPEPVPLPPAAELVPVAEEPPGGASPLVRLLSRLTTEDLELAVGELDQLERRIHAERAVITEALETKAA